MASFIITNSGTISLVINNKAYSIAPDHVNYRDIKATIKNKAKDSVFVKLLDVAAGMAKLTKGKLEFVDDHLHYNGKRLNGVLVSRILQLRSEGFPFEPMFKFLENLLQNPNESSVEELYQFLEHKALPITEDGCFLAYKRVNHNWFDFHSNTIDNHVGNKIVFDRSKVDPNRLHECSYGLHVGAFDYLSNYHNNEGRIIIVKVNPKDAVAVPKDYDMTKLRVCEYIVVAEFDGLMDASSVYQVEGNRVVPAYISEDDNWDSDVYVDPDGDYDSDSEDYEEYYEDDDDLEEDEDGWDDDDEFYDEEEDTDLDEEEEDEPEYGVKPSGQKYYARRDHTGKFTR